MKLAVCTGLIFLIPVFFCPVGLEAKIVDREFEPEEILVQLEVSKLFSHDIVAYRLNDTLYLPFVELFHLLGIKAEFSTDNTLITGIFLSQATYVIDLRKGKISFDRNNYDISKEQFIIEGMEVFLHQDVLLEVFEFNTEFDYRGLKVILNTTHELPVIRDQKRKQARSNLDNISGQEKAEYILPFQRNLIDGWMADWSYNSTGSVSSSTINNSFSLNTGGELAGGDFIISGNVSDQYGVNWNQFRGRYRYITNDKRLNQIIIGNLTSPAVFGPGSFSMNGIELTNRPVSHPTFFGQYDISDFTEPNWDVELYVNNRLVDFAIADDDGYYQFQAPLSYGSTMIDLKHIGPWGELETQSRLIQKPHSFVRRGDFEYSVVIGGLRNHSNQEYAQGDFRWGLTSRVTIGSGVQHINDAKVKPFAPYATASVRLTDRIIVHGKHVQGAFSKGSFSYRSPSRRSLQASYTLFEANPIVNRSNKKSEARVSLSLPFRIYGQSYSSNLGARVNNHGNSNYLNLNAGFSSRFYGTFLNVRSQAQLIKQGANFRPQTVKSTLSLSRRMLYNIRLRPRIEYDYIRGQLIRIETTLERRFSRRSQLSVTYNRDMQWNQNRLFVGFRIDFPSARHNSTARLQGNSLNFSQTTSGAIGWNSTIKKVFTDNRNWVGKASLSLQPYLDLGGDEKHPVDIQGLTADVKGGRLINAKGENMLLADLNAYRSYFIDINDHSLDNPLWIPKHKSYEMQVMPNRFNVIEIPIIAVGEVVGTVTRITNGAAQGIRGIKIIFNQTNGDYTAETTTYSGGHYFTVGLPPGEYTAQVDPVQLERMSLASPPDSINFIVEPTVHGDIVENLDFRLGEKKGEHTGNNEESKPHFSVQIGAFINKHLAEGLVFQINQTFNKQGIVYYDTETDYYHSHIGGFNNRLSAEKFIDKLSEFFPDLIIDPFVVPHR